MDCSGAKMSELDWHTYWLNNHWWRRIGARFLNYLTYMNMPDCRKGLVLEVGCGKSRSSKKYPMWIGVDRERIVKPTLIADANFLPFRNHTFKIVYSFGLLEHLGDSISRALKEMQRVADLVYFSVPRKDGLFDKIHRMFDLLKHQWIFPKETYYSQFHSCQRVRQNLLGCIDVYCFEGGISNN
jgi:SAM-dependent methyltransferase